jgi:iron complex outermembrane receptor protein
MSKRAFYVIITLIVGLMFVLCDAFVLCAQETESDEFTLEEITVTAQKRAENQQRVAIAMDVIPADGLREVGKFAIDDILSNVSTVMVQKSADGMRISLRGYSDLTGTNFGQSTSTPAVAVNIDGVYSSRKDTGRALYDMERVEVLFGPQSTMYASNSPGGIVNIETASPKLDKYEASGVLEYGNFNLLHTEGMVNVPASDILALRASFQTLVHDGYISNGGDDEDIKSARLKALLKPNDKFSFTVTGEMIKTSTHQSGSSVDAFVNQGDVANPWYSSRTLGGPNFDTTKKINGLVDLDMGAIGSLSVMANYADHKGGRDDQMRQPDGTLVHMIYDTYGDETGVEVRMTSAPDFLFKWILGFNYYDSEDWLDGLGYDESGNLIMYDGSIVNSGQDTPQYRLSGGVETAKAAFANVTYPLTDRFRVTGGYRISWDDYVFKNSEIRGAPPPSPPGTMEDTGYPVPSQSANNYNRPDYKLGIEYDLGPNSMLFADYATSYRVQAMGGGKPGGSTTGSYNETFPPETLDAFSVGAKNRFFDNTLQLNTTAFYYDYKNFAAGDMQFGYYGPIPATEENFNAQLSSPDPNASGFGDGIWYGLDIQSTMLLTAKDTVNFSLSYLHSEWTDLVFDYYYDYKLAGGFGQPSTYLDVQPAPTVSFNGKPMTMSPDWTVTLSYTHKFMLQNGASIDGRIDSKYKSAYELSWRHAKDYPNNYQEVFVNGDVMLVYYSADGKWTFSGYCKNVRNYAEKRSYFGEPANELRIGPPRTYGAVLSVKF